MKFRTILATLLLPCVVAAQEAPSKHLPLPPHWVTQAGGDVPILLRWDDLASNIAQYIPNSAFVVPAISQARVNLNLRNAPLKEAIKQLTDQTKQQFVLENDVPADARITAVAKNIRLSTALDLITDVTGLNWGPQMLNERPQTSKEPTSKAGGLAIHIGKNVSRGFFKVMQNGGSLNRWNAALPDNTDFYKSTPLELIPQKLNDPLILNGSRSIIQGKPLDYGAGNSKTGLKFLPGTRLNFSVAPNGSAPDNATNLSTAYTLANTLIQTNKVAEVRSTFTCPHCKQQVTVIHQHQSPKCDQCGRVFRDDWQFCPFDGAKRPATAGIDWQFCPICGKSVKPEVKADVKPGN
jgi:hypothetical protein